MTTPGQFEFMFMSYPSRQAPSGKRRNSPKRRRPYGAHGKPEQLVLPLTMPAKRRSHGILTWWTRIALCWGAFVRALSLVGRPPRQQAFGAH